MLINISKLGDGAFEEKLNRALVQAVENIMDRNTDFKKERKVTIEVCLKPTSEKRDYLQTKIKTKVTLAPEIGEDVELVVGKDLDGNIHINERRQMNLNDFTEKKEESKKTNIVNIGG